ncbi:MAG: TolC family protein [Kiritimatiellae bacterium]|nr:TolC family protein [Kiritimatiellia bacterium]
MSKSIVSFAFPFILLWACSAHAAPDALSISSVVAHARATHPLILEQESALRAALVLQRQAGIRPPPELDLEAGYKRAGEDGYELGVALLFPVERSGKRSARRGVAESEVNIARVALDQACRDIELQVRTQCYAFLAAEADAEAAREVANRSHAMIELLKERPAAGPGMVLELRVIEAGLLALQKTARDREAERDIARAAINVLLGREPSAALDLSDELVVSPKPLEFDSLAAAVERNPNVLKRWAEVERATQAVALSAYEASPDLQVGPYYSREEAGDVESVVGVALSVPLANRRARRGPLAERRAEAEAAWKAERMSALADVARLRRLYELAVQQANEMPAERVEALRDAAALADRQYRLGAIPVSLFLEMQREYLAVQQLRHEALLNALTREAELTWALGEVQQGGEP